MYKTMYFQNSRVNGMSNLVLGKPWIVNLVSGSPEHECVYIVYNVTATVDGPLNPGVTSSKDVNSVLIYSPSFLLNPVWLFPSLRRRYSEDCLMQWKSVESNKSRTHWLSLYGRKKHETLSKYLLFSSIEERNAFHWYTVRKWWQNCQFCMNYPLMQVATWFYFIML